MFELLMVAIMVAVGSRKKRKIPPKLLLIQQHIVAGSKMKKCELKYVIAKKRQLYPA